MSDTAPGAAPPYSVQRLRGLHAHTSAQQQPTVRRLAEAITVLTAQGRPVTARTIQDACGLRYSTMVRNAEAYALYCTHRTRAGTTRRRQERGDLSRPTESAGRAPRHLGTTAQLRARLQAAQQQLHELEAYNARLLQERVECDVQLLRLEARLAAVDGVLGTLRIQDETAERPT